MLKLLPILFFAAVNITQISIFEIEGIFSSGHVNAMERYFDENKVDEDDLFIVQYNANDVNQESILKLGEILESVVIPKAIWVGPNKTEINAELLKGFDYVGVSPGSLITNISYNTNENLFNPKQCLINTCTSTLDQQSSNSSMLVTGEEGIYEGYMIVGSIGAFIEKLGMEDITSNLDNSGKIINFDINSTSIEEIKFIKPSLAERFYISISNPLFTYMFFGLGFALIGLELFAIGPGIMALIGALLISFSSMTFDEFGLNYYGLVIFLISFIMYIKILSRGYFGFLGIGSFLILHSSCLIMFNNYELKINQFLMFGCSVMLAFFYFIAIPTVIRSRLTTDTSAMSSLSGKKVKVIEILSEKQVLVKLDDKTIVVNKNDDKSFEVLQDAFLSEEDGKLSI
jgi:membrane protein implicated in regulation of membrane protease activity